MTRGPSGGDDIVLHHFPLSLGGMSNCRGLLFVSEASGDCTAIESIAPGSEFPARGIIGDAQVQEHSAAVVVKY